MPLEIFISHSTNIRDGDENPSSPDQQSFLMDLFERLRAEEENGENLYRVILDKDHLKVGDPWRKKLIDGLGSCGAGIVLLNKKAILDSGWVLAEANIMRWRGLVDEDFKLILIALGQGSKAALRENRNWKPLAFSEIQFLDGGTEFDGPTIPDDTFQRLVESLPRPSTSPPKSRFQLWQKLLGKAVKKTLPDMSQAIVDEETQRLSVEGVAGLGDFFDRQEAEIETDHWVDLVQLLSSSWIDPKSALALAEVLPDAAGRSIAIACNYNNFTPERYARQASSMRPEFAWKVAHNITANEGFQSGGELYKAIVNEVRADLKQAYRKALTATKTMEQVSDADIRNQIQLNLDQERPVPTFVVLPDYVATNSEVKAEILAVFPGVSFLHQVKVDVRDDTQQDLAKRIDIKARGVAQSIAGCAPMDPHPDLETEKEAHDAFHVSLNV